MWTIRPGVERLPPAAQDVELEAFDVHLHQADARLAESFVQHRDGDGNSFRACCGYGCQTPHAVVRRKMLWKHELGSPRCLAERGVVEIDRRRRQAPGRHLDVLPQDFKQVRVRLERHDTSRRARRCGRQDRHVADVGAGIHDRVARIDQSRQDFRHRRDRRVQSCGYSGRSSWSDPPAPVLPSSSPTPAIRAPPDQASRAERAGVADRRTTVSRAAATRQVLYLPGEGRPNVLALLYDLR